MVTVAAAYFGMSIEAENYNFGYYGGPVEAAPAPLPSVVRSWNVWSPGDGSISYLGWQDLNPSAGVYNFAALDSWVAMNKAQGTAMVYTFSNPPAWAGGATATDLADFQSFVTAIVEHANGAIKYWEGLNEFNISNTSPAVAVQMQEIIYNTVHALDPGALVLSPTVNSSPSALGSYEAFLNEGGGAYFDIAAFHGYNGSTGESVGIAAQDFTAMLASYGITKPAWDTEWGMEAPVVITDPTAQQSFVSVGLIEQAAAGVQTEMFYAYDNTQSELYDSKTGHLTPAGIAYFQTETWLNGAALGKMAEDSNGVFTLPITEPNGNQDLLIWDASGSASYKAAHNFGSYETVDGQIEPIHANHVEIGTVPILLIDPPEHHTAFPADHHFII